MPAGTRFLPSTISRRFLEQEALHLSVGFAMVLPFWDLKSQQKLRQKVPKPSHLSLSKNDVFFSGETTEQIKEEVAGALREWSYMGVSKNNGIPKSSISIGFSIINYKPSIWGYPPIFGNIHMAIYYGYDGDLIPSFNSWFTRHFRRYRILAQNLSHARPLEDSKFPFFSNKTKRTKDSKKNPSTRRNPRRPPYLQPSQGETCWFQSCPRETSLSMYDGTSWSMHKDCI